MPLVARLGDTSTHGGAIVTACSKTFAEGPPIARRGDILACPKHGLNPIVDNVSPKTFAEGEHTAKTGSITVCKAVIISGAVKTLVD